MSQAWFCLVIYVIFFLGSKQSYDGKEEDLLSQVRKAIDDVKPENIGKKVVDNVEDHSTDTKRGEIN